MPQSRQLMPPLRNHNHLYYPLPSFILLAIKSFNITYNGKEEEIQYEDDINFGIMEGVLRNTVNDSNPVETKINLGEYRIQILQAVLRRAPFDTKGIGAIKNIPHKVANEILKHIMEDYSLDNFLEGRLRTLLSSEIMKSLDLGSIQSVSPSSDGIKKQSTKPVQNS